MGYKSDIADRRSIRLRDYDYSQFGGYFVTICTQNHKCVFGKICEGRMVLNDAGMMVQRVWDEIPKNYPGVEIDQFTVMPNHIHGIILIVGAGPCACPGETQHPETGNHGGIAPTLSLPDVIHRFKTMTTKLYSDGVKQFGWQPYPARLWQRNYYEHVIRNENDLQQTRQYIYDNPEKWDLDLDNPEVIILKES